MTAVPPARWHGSAASGEQPPTAHADDEVLSLSLEGASTDGGEDGLLDPTELAAVQAHVEACPRCLGRRAELAEVPALLRQLAAGASAEDTRVPADVAAAIDSALGRERATDPRATPHQAAAPVLPLRPRRPRSTVLLQSAAALAAVGLVGGVVWGAVSSSGGGEAASTGSAGQAAPAAGASSGADASAAARGPVLVSTALDLDADTLAAGVASALREPPTASTPLPADGAAGPLSPLLGAQPLATCVSRLAPGQRLTEVLGVRWKGAPAAVLVFPTAGDPAHVDAYAVVPSCPVGEFLGFVRVPR